MEYSTLSFGHFEFQFKGVSDVVLLPLLLLIAIPVFKASSVDTDQPPRPVASDLGLHCMPMSFL